MLCWHVGLMLCSGIGVAKFVPLYIFNAFGTFWADVRRVTFLLCAVCVFVCAPTCAFITAAVTRQTCPQQHIVCIVLLFWISCNRFVSPMKVPPCQHTSVQVACVPPPGASMAGRTGCADPKLKFNFSASHCRNMSPPPAAPKYQTPSFLYLSGKLKFPGPKVCLEFSKFAFFLP